jgi:hypothetical protein
LLGFVETMRFLGCSRRRMTSSTVVLRTVLADSASSPVKGVYDVMRKWQRGMGIRLATMPTRSLCM